MSVARNTSATYETALREFERFRVLSNMEKLWPPPMAHIVHFVAYLSLCKKAPSTVSSYLSGIGFKCKLLGGADHTKSFLVTKMVEGIRRASSRRDARLPISIDLLSRIVLSLPIICSSTYEAKLFSFTYVLTFFGLLRVGELTLTNKMSIEHIIQYNDIRLDVNGGKLLLHIRHSKTDQRGKGVTLAIPKLGGNLCPVKHYITFQGIRGNHKGPLLCHFGGAPLTRYQFGAVLHKSLKHLGVEAKNYKAHSFRIGCATALFEAGISEAELKTMGRWSSQAYKSYIRVPQFHV